MRKLLLPLLCLISPLTLATDDYTIELYDLYCTACHAVEASGAPQAFTDEWEDVLDKGMEETVNNAIAGTGNMPAMGTCVECTPEDMEALIQYMATEK